MAGKQSANPAGSRGIGEITISFTFAEECLTFLENEAVSPVLSVILRGPGLAVSLTHDDDSRFIQGHVETGAGTAERLTPCPCRTTAELVIERLRRGCNTKLYFTLLEIVRAMMAAGEGRSPGVGAK